MSAKLSKIKRRRTNISNSALSITPDSAMKVIGNPLLLKDTADGTVAGAINDIYLRLGNFKFKKTNDFISAIYEFIGLPVEYSNSLSNSSFNINTVESSISNSVSTSHNYLDELENSFIDILTNTFNENDIHRDSNSNLCISIEKDFIISQNRKAYKTSKFYNKYISIDDINKNRNLFLFYPIVIIDDKVITSFKVRCPIDGMTEISFDTNSDTLHFNKMQVYLIRNCYSSTSEMDKMTLVNRQYILPTSILPEKINNNKTNVFYSVLGDNKRKSGLYKVKYTDDTHFIIDNKIPELEKIINLSKKIKFTFIRINDCYESSVGKILRKRVDSNIVSFISVISPNNKKDYTTFDMPIPTDNIIVTKRNKESNGFNNNISIIDNLKIIKHYPNIYEFEILDSSKDDPNIVYDASFFYHTPSNTFKFKNKFDAVYRYFYEKYSPKNMEEIAESFIYGNNPDKSLFKFFMKIFNYTDYEYTYNIKDFESSPYKKGFEYKLHKMDNFIKENPDILREYIKEIVSDFTNYYLDVSSLNLDQRIRLNTNNEIRDSKEAREFSSEYYMFRLVNDDRYPANYRVFIDGILFTDVIVINQEFCSYIYIPKNNVSKTSYIEVEKFYKYENQTEMLFKTINQTVDIILPNNPFINATLNDIFITDANYNHINIDDFNIYSVIEGSEIDISPKLNNFVKYEDFYDPNNGFYIKIGNKYVNVLESQLPIKYAKLSHIRIRLSNIAWLNQKLYLFINKESAYLNTKMNNDGVPKIKLNGDYLPCRNEDSYIRIFINGRFVNIPHKIINEQNGVAYWTPDNKIIKKDSIITTDISPFSYNLEYSCDLIPENGILNIQKSLDKPFDFKYYDVYLNGKKLTNKNIQIISTNKIAIMNVNSRKNLRVYSKDLDICYFQINNPKNDLVDDMLESKDVSKEDKNALITSIIHSYDSSLNLSPIVDTEPDYNNFDDLKNI